MKIWLAKFKKCKKAATAIEYALIASLIAVVIILATKFVGSQLNYTFSHVGSALSSANG